MKRIHFNCSYRFTFILSQFPNFTLTENLISHILQNPYFQERSLREESQKAAERFERATSILGIAKQQVSLTQESLSRQTSVLPECLEVGFCPKTTVELVRFKGVLNLMPIFKVLRV